MSERAFPAKICGITRAEDALMAAELGAWAVGFIFYARSPRFITPERAAEIIKLLPPMLEKIGVFVNPTRVELSRIAEISGITLIQLHGDESIEDCAQAPLPVIKAVRLDSTSFLETLTPFQTVTRALLVDASSAISWGGSGKPADWPLASRLRVSARRLILAGGLNTENVAHAIREGSPDAIDLSSGVEDCPGIKNHEKLRGLFAVLRTLPPREGNPGIC